MTVYVLVAVLVTSISLGETQLTMYKPEVFKSLKQCQDTLSIESKRSGDRFHGKCFERKVNHD